jgi:hypothetical protein
MDIADFANLVAPSVSFSSRSTCFKEERVRSPIDEYRTSVVDILNFGTKDLLDSSAFAGRLLVLGIVSAGEGYVRSILSRVIQMCPVSQSTSAEKMISFGGILWHSKDNFGRSAFEHTTFLSKDDLEKCFKNFLGFKLEDKKFKSLLEEYNAVCQLRHGIVHNDGILPGRNAIQLEVPKFSQAARIHIKYAHLQEIAAVVNTLVFTLNRELFEEVCKRWAVDWRKRADWDPSEESSSFNKIWGTFHSCDECKYRAGRKSITRGKCKQKIISEYGL